MSSQHTSGVNQPDWPLVERIRQGDADAWAALIAKFEGRLLAFTKSRIRDHAACEDIVQETFVGFLISLPNYDGSRPLESYLFSICAYKLTDHLRREGRRPAIQLHGRSSSVGGEFEPVGGQRVASSIARSGERKAIEAQAIREAIAEQIARWKSTGSYEKLKVIELLYVRGDANQDVAAAVNLTQQQVANYKSDFQTRLRAIIQRQQLDESVFPELSSD